MGANAFAAQAIAPMGRSYKGRVGRGGPTYGSLWPKRRDITRNPAAGESRQSRPWMAGAPVRAG
jgi:hypothetical protein